MELNISTHNGNIKCDSFEAIENLILQSTKSLPDDIWISRKEYPCLAISINGTNACIHYFLNDEGDMWQAIGNGEEDTEFMTNGEISVLPGEAVVSIEMALLCAKNFFESNEKPCCVQWREL